MVKIKILTFSIIVCLLPSCASKPTNFFNSNLNNGNCEEALKNLPISDRTVLDETQTVTGTIASYTLSGIAYGADVTIILVGGVAATAILCSPFIAMELSLNTSSNMSVQCFDSALSIPLVKKMMPKESLGRKVYQNTEKWRCPDLTDFSKNLRSVASCYENKNDKPNLEKALIQLDLIKDENFQNNCVDEKEKKMISSQYENITKKLEQLSSNSQ